VNKTGGNISSLIDDIEHLQEDGKMSFISFEIRITDSGPGLSEEDISKLFINFSKLADHSKVNNQGTGLGLSICKHLIEQMGGTVMVQSKGIGQGSTFIIKLQTISKISE